MQFEHGFCLSHLTFLRRQVTHDRAFKPCGELCDDFLSIEVWMGDMFAAWFESTLGADGGVDSMEVGGTPPDCVGENMIQLCRSLTSAFEKVTHAKKEKRIAVSNCSIKRTVEKLHDYMEAARDVKVYLRRCLIGLFRRL